MKKMKMAIMFLVLSGTIISSSVFAQSASTNLSIVNKLDLSADQVWEQVRIMDNIDELSTIIADLTWNGPRGAGAERVCKTADGQGYFKEKILSFSDSERAYSYNVYEGAPVKNYIGEFRVSDLGYNKCALVWTAQYEFVENPQMTADQFEQFAKNAVGEILDNMVERVSL